MDGFFLVWKDISTVFLWDKIVPTEWWLQHVWFDWSFYGMFDWCFDFVEYHSWIGPRTLLCNRWILSSHIHYCINFPTSNVHDLIHPFSPIYEIQCKIEYKYIVVGNSNNFSNAIQGIAWMNPSMQNSQLFVALRGDKKKRSASRFNRQSVFDVFWCSKVVKSTVFYGDICHLKRRMSLRKNMTESSKKDYQWW